MAIVDFAYYFLICAILLAFFAVFWAISGFIIFRVVDRKLRACPSCKAKASGIIVDTEIEPLGTVVDSTGKTIEQIKSEKVTDHYECKICNHTWMRTYERKERLPIDKRVSGP